MAEIEDLEEKMKEYMKNFSTCLHNVLFINLEPEEIQERSKGLVDSFVTLRNTILQSKINEHAEASKDKSQLQNLLKEKTEALMQYNEMRKNIGRLC